MKLGVDTKHSTTISTTPTNPSMITSRGFDAQYFETINVLDALHIEAENLAQCEAYKLLELRILDAVAVNAEQTQDELAADFCPKRKHLAYYAIASLLKRGLIERWKPGRVTSARSAKRAICWRLTQPGAEEIARINEAFESPFSRLFRGQEARELAAALKRAAK